MTQDRFSIEAQEVRASVESYELRHSIDGRARVISDALRRAYALGIEAERRGRGQSALIAGLPLPPEAELHRRVGAAVMRAIGDDAGFLLSLPEPYGAEVPPDDDLDRMEACGDRVFVAIRAALRGEADRADV